ANHVHPGLAKLLERGAIGRGISGKGREVERGPADAAAEDRCAVHDEAKTVTVCAAIDVDGAEANATEVYGLRHTARNDVCTHAVQRLRAVRVRPPEIRPRHARDAGQHAFAV